LGPLTGDPPTHPNIDHEVQSATVQKFTANAGVDQTVNEDTQVTLNASKTSPQGQDYTFVWTFNDKEPKTLTGIIATYIFKTPGIYPVTLTVTDSEGNTSTDETIITVKDVTLPVAVITLEGITQGQTIDVGQKITFNGTKSYDPEDGTIQSYSWSFGDGETSSSPSVSHQYDKAGTYTVTLNATDARGNNKNSATATVTIVQTQSTQIIAIIVAIVAIGIVGAGSAIWLMRRKKRS
jgi:PKD repeat protein